MEEYLSVEEIESLSDPVKGAFEKLLTDKRSLQELLESANAEQSTQQVEFEQRYFDLEQKLLEAKDLHAEVQARNDELSHKLKQYTDEGLATKNEVLSLRENIALAKVENDTLKEKVNCLTLEKQDLADILERRSKEIEHLTDEVSRLQEKYANADHARIEAQINNEKLLDSEGNHDFELRQLKNQVEILNDQVNQQMGELHVRNSEIQVLRKEKSTASLELRQQLEKLKAESETLKNKLEESQKLNANYESQVKRYIDKLKDAEDFNQSLESNYRQEVENQTKLAELYRVANVEAEEKNQKLLDAVAQLQEMVNEGKNVAENLEMERTRIREEFELYKNQSENELDNTKIELDRANELIEISRKQQTLVEMSPTAEAASKYLKSGLTLTQLYSNYVDATQSLSYEKAENQRLKKYIDQIVEEIEQKAPFFRQQKENYENSLVSIAELTQKLDLAVVESRKTKYKIESLERSNEYLKRQIDSLEQVKSDLCKQVQHLLKEVTVAKGGTVVDDLDDSVLEDNFANDSARVIDANLVNISDIQELQLKNTQLLAALRAISDEKEAEQAGKFQTRLDGLEMKLASALKEVDITKDELRVAKELTNSANRQRDLYKVLLEQQTNILDSSGNVAGPEVQSSLNTSRSSIESRKDHSMSDEERNMLKSAIAEQKNEMKALKEDNRKAEMQFNEELAKYTKENSDLRIQNAQITSELRMVSEKIKLQEMNCETYQKEIESFRKQNTTFQSNIAKYQTNIDILSGELKSLQEKYSAAIIERDSLKMEKEVMKNTELHLTKERDRLLADKKAHSTLFAHLDSLKNSLELNATDQKLRYSSTVEALQRNLDAAQRRAREIDNDKRAAVKELENKLKDAENKLLEQQEAYRAKVEEVTTLKNEFATMQSQMQSKITQLESSPARAKLLALSQQPECPEDLRELSQKLEHANQEIALLRENNAAAEAHINNYKDMCTALEQSYKSETSELKGKVESQAKSIEEVNETIQNQYQTIARLESDNAKLRDEIKDLTDSSDSAHGNLVKKSNDLERQLNESLMTNNNLQSQLRNLNRLVEDKNEALRSIAEKLEAANETASTNVGQVSGLELTITEITKEKEAAENQISSLKQELSQLRAQIQSSEENFARRESTINESVKELEAQNKILLDEIERVGKAMNESRDGLSFVVDDNSDVTLADKQPGDGSDRTENLIAVVRHLRREKEIAQARLEVAQSEGERFKQKLQFAKKRVSDLEKQLKEEEDRHQSLYQSISQQEELNEKVQQIVLLQESNSYLRKENASLVSQVKAEKERQSRADEARLKPLEEEVAALKSDKEVWDGEREILTSEIERWKVRNNELLERITKLNTQETHKTQERIKELERQTQEKTAEVRSLEGRLLQNQHRMTEIDGKYKASSTEANLLREKVSQLESELNSLKSERLNSAKEKQEMQAKLEAIEKELISTRTVNEKFKSNIERIPKIQKLAKEYKEKFQKAEAEMNALKEQQASADSAATSEKASAERAELEGKVKSLQSMISSHQTKLADYEKKIAELESAAADSGSTSPEVSRLEQELSDLRAENHKLETAKKKFLDIIKVAQNQKSDLKKQKDAEINAQASKIHELETRLESMKKEIKSADEQPSTSQPKLAVHGHPRAGGDLKPSDRPSANIKPMQPQRAPQATIRPTPQPAHAVVQPVQSIQSSESEQSASASASAPHARVAPQVRGEVTPTTSTTYEYSAFTPTSSSADATVESSAAMSFSDLQQRVMPSQQTQDDNLVVSQTVSAGLPQSSLPRLTVEPFQVAPSTIVSPTVHAGADSMESEAPSSSQQTPTRQLPTSSVQGVPSTTPPHRASPRQEGGPADSSHSDNLRPVFGNKRARDSGSGEEGEGKRARVLPTSSDEPCQATSTANVYHGSGQPTDVGSSSEAPASSSAGDSSAPEVASIDAIIYQDAYQPITSSGRDVEFASASSSEIGIYMGVDDENEADSNILDPATDDMNSGVEVIDQQGGDNVICLGDSDSNNSEDDHFLQSIEPSGEATAAYNTSLTEDEELETEMVHYSADNEIVAESSSPSNQQQAVSQSDTYNIEAMVSGAGPSNVDNPFWTKSPDRSQQELAISQQTFTTVESTEQDPHLEESSRPSSPGGGNQADFVGSSSAAADGGSAAQQQPAAPHQVARKTARGGRPRMLRRQAPTPPKPKTEDEN